LNRVFIYKGGAGYCRDSWLILQGARLGLHYMVCAIVMF